jgi:hypothetical protein
MLIILAARAGMTPALDQSRPVSDADSNTWQTFVQGAAEFERSAHALVRRRFEERTLEWVANVRAGNALYQLASRIAFPGSSVQGREPKYVRSIQWTYELEIGLY